MDDNRSIASSIVSELRITKLKDNPRTSSLNNLLPEDELSEMANGEEEEMSGYCIQTEAVPEQINGYHKRSSCEAGCGPADKQHHLENNKMEAFEQQNQKTNKASIKSLTPSVVVTPCTPESLKDQAEITDSYEVTV